MEDGSSKDWLKTEFVHNLLCLVEFGVLVLIIYLISLFK